MTEQTSLERIENKLDEHQKASNLRHLEILDKFQKWEISNNFNHTDYEFRIRQNESDIKRVKEDSEKAISDARRSIEEDTGKLVAAIKWGVPIFVAGVTGAWELAKLFLGKR